MAWNHQLVDGFFPWHFSSIFLHPQIFLQRLQRLRSATAIQKQKLQRSMGFMSSASPRTSWFRGKCRTIWKVTIKDTTIFDFHDYGRKCIFSQAPRFFFRCFFLPSSGWLNKIANWWQHSMCGGLKEIHQGREGGRSGTIAVHVWQHILGGGFKYFLFSSRSLGKWSNLTNIFQMGWNHQVVYELALSAYNKNPSHFAESKIKTIMEANIERNISTPILTTNLVMNRYM